MSWFLLILAGLFEVGWAIGLKASAGLTKPLPSVLTILSLIASFWLLALAVRNLSIGTAYAVWTGIGAIGTVIVGMLVLGEPRNLSRIICLVLIAAGIIGLKFFSGKTS